MLETVTSARKKTRALNTSHLAVVALSLALVVGGGCGGMAGGKPTVTASRASGSLTGQAVKPPSVIYVSDFYLSPKTVTTSPGLVGRRDGPVSRLREDLRAVRGDDEVAKARKIVATLSDSITRELKRAGYRAERRSSASGLRQEFFPADTELPREGWLLGGWFEHVQEGNRVEQATIGFGRGSGQVSIAVIVSDLATNPRQPFLVMGSDSAQHRMPGGVVSKNPYAIAAKFVLSRGQSERDVKAMGSAIAKALVQNLDQIGDDSTKH